MCKSKVRCWEVEGWPVQERRNIMGGEGLPGRYRHCRSHLGHFSSSSKNVQKTVKKGHFCNNFPQILVQMKVSFHFMVRSAIFLSFKWLVSLICIKILCTRLTDMISMSLWLDLESDTAQIMARLHFYHSFMTITVNIAGLYRGDIDKQHVFDRHLIVTLKMSQLNYNWHFDMADIRSSWYWIHFRQTLVPISQSDLMRLDGFEHLGPYITSKQSHIYLDHEKYHIPLKMFLFEKFFL